MAISRASYWFSLLPLALYCAIEGLTFRLGNREVSGLDVFFPPGSVAAAEYHEAAARYHLFAAIVLLSSFTMLTLSLSVAEILRSTRTAGIEQTEKRELRKGVLFLIFLIVLTIITAYVLGSVAGEQRMLQNLGLTLFSEVLNLCHEKAGHDPRCVLGQYSPGKPPSTFEHYIDLIMILIAIGLSAASFGCCLALSLRKL